MKAFLSVLVAIAIVSEIALLRQNIALKTQLNEKKYLGDQASNVKRNLERRVQERRLAGQCLPSWGRKNTENRETPGLINTKYVILFCFSPTDCGSCIQNEVAIWNQFSQSKYKADCSVIGITASADTATIERLRKTYDFRFPIASVSDFETTLLRYGITSTPVILFGDAEQRRIISAFFPNSVEKSSDWFVTQVVSFLTNC